MEKEHVLLLVEDERPLAEAIKIKLRKEHFEVVTARSALQAMDYLTELGTVDAIWLDHYLLGKENGLDFVRKLKEEGGKWKNIPIFVVSNTAGPDKVHSYLQLGISKYYVKADNRLDAIVSELKKFLGKQGE